jgi:nucleotide-binding universal stress UspA family protein
MIKDILLNLTVGAARDPAVNYAASVATTFDAHLAAIAFAYEPVVPPTIMGGIPASFIDSQRAESEKAAAQAVARFTEVANRRGLSAEQRVVSESLAGAADLFARTARRCDLSILTQAEPDKMAPEELIIEAALFESGRPVLVVPYIQEAELTLDQVMVCWDGTRTAARAIGDAMPFLTRAKRIEIVIVANDPGKSDELPGADLGQHLARHKLTVDVKRIVAPDGDVGSTLLSHAADSGANLMVMGGYGHSRLREFVLGGVTRGVLEAMTVPVLMSH